MKWELSPKHLRVTRHSDSYQALIKERLKAANCSADIFCGSFSPKAIEIVGSIQGSVAESHHRPLKVIG